jgi:hypothetical protein
MADEIRKEVIVDVRVEKKDNEEQVDKLTHRIEALKKETQDLVKANQQLALQGKENSKEYLENTRQIEINRQKISDNTASRKGLVQAIIAEDNSIKSLKVRNAELIKQRDLIGTATSSNKKLIAEINKEIDSNNKTINENSSALEKQRLNIGNYASALDVLIPGLGGMVTGIEAGTKASYAFIATGIGAIIAAVGLALGALIAYFKGSEEGQNRLNKVMAIGSVIMEKITDVIEELGKQLFEAGGKLNWLGDQLGKLAEYLGGPLYLVLKGYGEQLVKEIEERATLITDLQKQANEQERALIEERARVAKEAAELRIQADELEGKARLDKVNQAIELERGLLEKELEFAKTKKRQAEIEAEDDPTIENKKKLAEANAELLNQEAAFSQGIRKLNKERIALERESLEEQRKLNEERKKELQAFLEEVNKINAEYREREETAKDELEILEYERKARELEGTELHQQALIDLEFARLQQSLEITDLTEAEKELIYQRYYDKLSDIATDAAKKRAAAEKKAAEDQMKIEELKNEAIIGGINLVTKERSVARMALTSIFKADAIQETTINTYNAAVAAYKSLAGIPIVGPVLGAVAAGAVTVFGLANIARIAGVNFEGFATGGRVGYRDRSRGPVGRIKDSHGTPVNRSNGDNRIITARVGEVVLTEEQQLALGGEAALRRAGVPGFNTGGRIITGSQTRAVADRINQSVDLTPIVDNINNIKTVLVLQDFEAKQAERDAPMQKAQVL